MVPNTGHAVLEDEPTPCARKALQAMFGGGAGVPVGGAPIKPCPAGPLTSPLLTPTPLAPARLADVAPAHGYHGRAGRTLQAVALTIADFDRQVTIALLAAGRQSASLTSLSSGGLRAGWAVLSKNGISFHDYSYVRGVTVSGTVKAEKSTLRIGGRAAAHGTLRLGRHRALVGELGGGRVHLNPASPTATAAIVGSDAQTSTLFAFRGAAVRAAAHRLAGLLGWLAWN